MMSATLSRTPWRLLQRPQPMLRVLDVIRSESPRVPHSHSGTVITCAVRGLATPKDATAKKKKSSKLPKSKNKDKSDKAEGKRKSQNQEDMDNIIAALDAPIRYEPTISAEEQERRRQIVRNYCIGRFEQHNAREHDLACKMRVKRHAVRMLPQNSELKKAALDPDVEDEIPNHGFPMWTPPIPGFNPEDYAEYFEEDDAVY